MKVLCNHSQIEEFHSTPTLQNMIPFITAIQSPARVCLAPARLILVCIMGSTPLLAKPFSQETVRSTSHQIDQYVAEYLQEKQIKAKPIIDDATFARRAYLSITGRIPTAEEARIFIGDNSTDKRRSLIDSLVGSAGYKSRMFNFWADLLRVQTQLEKHGLGWHVWIREAVEQNMPYDQFVHAMLSSSGLATENPAVGYYLRDRNMLLDNVSNTSQVFLGTQIGCAQCHDHPFDDWTQKQYYELAAFVGNTTYKSDTAGHLLRNLVRYSIEQDGGLTLKQGKGLKGEFKKRKTAGKKYFRDYSTMFKDFRRMAISDDPDKALRLPKDYQYNDGEPGDILTPKTLFGETIPDETPPEQRRKAFADWITSDKNPLFTKVIVNRLWAEVYGRGIVDPLDDWSETTRISHPELLDYLSQVMIATGYDVEQFMRVLYHTRLFESEVADLEPEMGGHYDFRGPVLRRMSAEEIYDSFLTLEFGNQDNMANNALAYRWESYAKNIDQFLNMSMPELIELNQTTDLLEEAFYAAKAEASELRTQAIKANGEGDTGQAEKLTQQAREIIKKAKLAQLKSNDMAAMGMMQQQMRTKPRPFMRASEHGSPAKLGSFMRQFGSSDRMTPDASNSVASITQTLTLLNGKEVTKLTDGKGKLAQALRQASSPAERLDILFLSIYGCMPGNEERLQLEPMASSPSQLAILARAMINSKRFLFIQ